MKVYIVVQPQTLNTKPAIRNVHLDKQKADEEAATLDFGHVIERTVKE